MHILSCLIVFFFFFFEKIENDEIYSDVYVVMEHLPHRSCSQLPVEDEVRIEKISARWVDTDRHPLTWETVNYHGVCNSDINADDNNTTIAFSWDHNQALLEKRPIAEIPN